MRAFCESFIFALSVHNQLEAFLVLGAMGTISNTHVQFFLHTGVMCCHSAHRGVCLLSSSVSRSCVHASQSVANHQTARRGAMKIIYKSARVHAYMVIGTMYISMHMCLE